LKLVSERRALRKQSAKITQVSEAQPQKQKKLVDRDKRQRVMKEMLKTLNEQAEREKAAESYIDGLFSRVIVEKQ
jgi:hypothetical protein